MALPTLEELQKREKERFDNAIKEHFKLAIEEAKKKDIIISADRATNPPTTTIISTPRSCGKTTIFNEFHEKYKGFELTGEWAGVRVIQLPTNYTLQLGDVIDPRYILHQEQEQLRDYIPFNQEYDNINSNKEVEQHRERKCWVCGKALSFSECLDTELNNYYFITHRSANEKKKENIENKVREQLNKQWESDKVEIPCCDCFKILDTIINNNTQFKYIRTIRIERIELYHIIKESCQDKIEKEIKKITIFWNANAIGVECTEIQFNNLVPFLDISPEVVRELLGESDSE